MDVCHQVVPFTGFLSRIFNNSNRALWCFLHISICISLANTTPFGDVFSAWQANQGDVSFLAKCLDKSLVLIIVTFLRKNTKKGFLAMKDSGALMKSTSQSIKDQSIL